MRNRILLVVLNFCCFLYGAAQLPHTFTRYTSDDGFPQRIASYIVQDAKGLMWFGTWDGLYSFDGYNFQCFKANSNDSIQLGSNRILKIQEDGYHCMWVLSDDYHIYHFDIEHKQFLPIPFKNYAASDFFIDTQNNLWITTRDHQLILVEQKEHEVKAVNFFSAYNLSVPRKIYHVCQDEKQHVWVLTDNGLHRYSLSDKKTVSWFTSHSSRRKAAYDIYTDDEHCFIASDKGEVLQWKDNQFTSFYLPTNSSVVKVHLMADDKLLLGTKDDGIFLYNLDDRSFKHYTTATHSELKSNRVTYIYVDKHQEAWIQSEGPGVVHFNPETEKFKYFIQQDKYGNDIKDSRLHMTVVEDVNDILWMHIPGGGFAWYDRDERILKPFYNPALQDGWSSHNYLIGFYSDKQGNLWFSTFKDGLMKATFSRNLFSLQTMESDDPDFPGNNVRAVFQATDGCIWLGSKDKIIRLFDKDMNYLGNLTREGNIVPHSRDELGMAYTFTEDKDGRIWIGTKGNGLIAAVPRQSGMKYSLRTYVNNPHDLYSLSSNDIYSLLVDGRQRLWIATYGQGLNYLDLDGYPSSVKFIHHRNELKGYPANTANRMRCLTLSPEGDIYAGTTNGIIICNNPEDAPGEMIFRHVARVPGDNTSLSNNNVHDIFFSKAGEMYACTFGGGFNKLIGRNTENIQFRSYASKDGLVSDIILSAEEDGKGNIWFATEHELCKYDPITDNIFNYPNNLLSERVVFNEGGSLRMKNGRLAFNTMGGVLHFHPDSVQNNNYVPPVVLTTFQLIGEDTEGNTGLSANIDAKKGVTLTHRQNGFNLQFAALDMRNPGNIQYAYRLEGFDKQWNEIGRRHYATYTNLPHGKYVLKIRSTNSDGIWVNNVRTLQITVLPSFWETPWAYLLYALGIVLIIFTAAYILFVIFRLKHKVATEQEISDIKLRFFTNISHELRTPLTLITGPVEQILQRGELQEIDREQLVLVERNSNRMLRLVNQILDFRKIQNKKMKMHVQQVDVVPFVTRVMESFNGMADEHQIDFKLATALKSHLAWVDADKLENILFNLLSNAFKYTPEGNEIKVSIEATEKDIVFRVKDQGVGIDEQKQKMLFQRFENFVGKNLFSQASTGIGLSLVKELVEMHHGTISVSSRIGEGTCFTVQLPSGKDHFDAGTEFILSDSVLTDTSAHSQNLTLARLSANTETDANNDKDTLLIVEDNTELRFFLRSIFVSHFKVVEAENGKVGWEKSLRLIPDIIISDVMMPEMDGITFMQKVREERTTSHIPIILLTAKSNVESRVEGMEKGADDYLTKPFNANYLKARVFNLLEQRKKLQALYCTALSSDTDQEEEEKESLYPLSGLVACDREFMGNLLTFIEGHLENGSLMVEELSQEMGMSRSSFFKKIKALTGLSPNELIKDIRIKRAAVLIRKNNYTMQQVAFMVGFNDSHYFSRCFKQIYGITPTDYKEQASQ